MLLGLLLFDMAQFDNVQAAFSSVVCIFIASLTLERALIVLMSFILRFPNYFD